MMLLLALCVPAAFLAAIAGAGLLPDGARPRVRRVAAVAAPAAVLPALVLAVQGSAAVEAPWLLFGATAALDGVGRPLLMTAGVLYGAALAAVGWRRQADAEVRSATLSGFLLASYLGNIGVYVAADTVSFYLAFAVMSFAAVGLVIHYRTEQARRATVIYLVMAVLSETALLAAMIMTVHAGGVAVADAPQAVIDSPRTGLILVLFFLGFGIKAGVVPLHVWLPLAHPAAPPAASAVLSGAMVKAGLVGWLRFFPLDEADGGGAVQAMAWTLLALSLLGAFGAAVVGVVQNDPKVILAYSTISQMGFLGAVIAAGMLVPAAAPAVTAAVVLYGVHHGFAKGALFLGVPVVKRHGRGPLGAVVLAGMAWAGLAIAGAPWTSGAFAKYMGKEAVVDVAVWGVGLDKILPLVATGSTVLLLRAAWVMWHGERSRGRIDGELLGWVAVCLAGLTVPWWAGRQWLGLEAPTWDWSTLWDMAWPILLGLALALFARLRPVSGSKIPPGDLVGAGDAAVLGLGRWGGQALDELHDGTRRLGAGVGTLTARAAETTQRGLERAETTQRTWSNTGKATLLLIGAGVVVFLLTWGDGS
jgi:formate hydrogenlyase subunit 3/multisubunit Na+/H+ antiporter MnhD subunit